VAAALGPNLCSSYPTHRLEPGVCPVRPDLVLVGPVEKWKTAANTSEKAFAKREGSLSKINSITDRGVNGIARHVEGST
jgi:hypothetical protein